METKIFQTEEEYNAFCKSGVGFAGFIRKQWEIDEREAKKNKSSPLHNIANPSPPAENAKYAEKYNSFLKNNPINLKAACPAELKINRAKINTEPGSYKESDLIKYFLQMTLAFHGADITISEFYYKGTRCDLFSVIKGKGVEFEL